MYDYIYKDVTYEQFKEISDRINKTEKMDSTGDEYLWGSTVIHYDGTNLRGDIKIHVAPGNSEVAKKVVKLVAEVITTV